MVMVTFMSVVTLLCFANLSRAETVTARLYQSDDSLTFIEINLTSPAPPTLIVEMRIPPGSQILRTSPQFSMLILQNDTTRFIVPKLI